MPAQGSRPRKIDIVILALILAIGIFLRLPPRTFSSSGPLHSIAYAWIIFFVFSPGVCVQYMVWLAPFVLILSPTFYVWLTATSSLFLFFFYNVTAGGLPWFIAVSTNKLNTVWTPWSLWPWTTLILGMILLWKKAAAADPSLRLFSLQTLREP